MRKTTLGIIAIAAAALVLATPATAADVNVYSSAAGISFDAQAAHVGSVLTVTGPEGIAIRKSFDGEAAYFSVADAGLDSLPDGLYTYELVLTPQIDRATREGLEQARAAGIDAGEYLNADANVSSGYFRVSGGAIVNGQAPEAGLQSATADVNAGGLENVSGAAQVFATDLIVQGSECVGFDCSTSESFGADTIRLKENNLRIHFNDTSNSGSFPTRDYRIEINSNANGGADYFAIQDVDAGNYPFRILGGAGNNALYVNASGNVGLGTASPNVELQVTDGDSPTMRLEQNQSAGFNAQTWDLAGNETNFFVRDVTNGSALPFRIFPGNGADDGLVITSDGDIGMGTDAPKASLHVRSTAGVNSGNDAHLVIEETSAQNVTIMASLKSNGRGQLIMEDTSADGDIWRFRTVENVFNIDAQSTASPVEFALNANSGDLTIQGQYLSASSRETKTNIQAVDPQEVLEKVVALPMSTWSYKKATDQIHLGPMAQDFYEAFGLGSTNTHISVSDTSGVALAAIQALYKQNQELMKRLAELEAKAAE